MPGFERLLAMRKAFRSHNVVDTPMSPRSMVINLQATLILMPEQVVAVTGDIDLTSIVLTATAHIREHQPVVLYCICYSSRSKSSICQRKASSAKPPGVHLYDHVSPSTDFAS